MTREEELAQHRMEVFALKNSIAHPPTKNCKGVVFTQAIMNGAHEFPYSHVQDYKGFELWKYEGGVKGDFCVRYTGFGRPVFNSKASPRLVGKPIARMPFFRVNITSAKFLKEFISDCIEGN